MACSFAKLLVALVAAVVVPVVALAARGTGVVGGTAMEASGMMAGGTGMPERGRMGGDTGAAVGWDRRWVGGTGMPERGRMGGDTGVAVGWDRRWVRGTGFTRGTVGDNGMAASETVASRHERWMAKHGRAYADEKEKAWRLGVFKSNVEFIDSVNAAGHGFWLAENRFADLTNAEFRSRRTGFKPSRAKNEPTRFRYANVSTDDLPPSVDWRAKGKDAVTGVKNQGECGCCWAFSAVAAMEGIVKLSTGNLVSLSEQEVVDCDVSGDDHGCNGGFMDNAFDFIIANGGLSEETKYPYTGKDDKCKAGSSGGSGAAATIKGHEDVPHNDEAALRKAVAHQPVSVAVDGGDMTFQFYKGGVLSAAAGCGTDLDHAITAVGYSVESDGTKYWLMKNSWGASWGEAGYIKMERDVADKKGVCGLAMMASYPTT